MQLTFVEPVHPGQRGEFEVIGDAELPVDLRALGLPPRPYKTITDVEYATAEWVAWHNRRRLHGA